jgi:hypothetical protein
VPSSSLFCLLFSRLLLLFFFFSSFFLLLLFWSPCSLLLPPLPLLRLLSPRSLLLLLLVSPQSNAAAHMIWTRRFAQHQFGGGRDRLTLLGAGSVCACVSVSVCVCVCVCMRVRVCVCVVHQPFGPLRQARACVRTWRYLYIYTYIHVYIYVYICVCIYVYMYMCMYRDTYIYICVCACVFVQYQPFSPNTGAARVRGGECHPDGARARFQVPLCIVDRVSCVVCCVCIVSRIVSFTVASDSLSWLCIVYMYLSPVGPPSLSLSMSPARVLSLSVSLCDVGRVRAYLLAGGSSKVRLGSGVATSTLLTLRCTFQRFRATPSLAALLLVRTAT